MATLALGSSRKLSSTQFLTAGAPLGARGLGCSTTGELEVRSQVRTSDTLASPCAISAADAARQRALVAQAWAMVGPLTLGAPMSDITHGVPQKLFSCGTVMPST